LPCVKVEKKYLFDSAEGKQSLAELFGEKSQLAIYHFMLGPDWEQGCPGCSLLADHLDGIVIHLAQRDVKFQAVSRAPMAKIEAFKNRMGWTIPWASSFGSDFNFDFGVSFTKEQMAKDKIYNFGTIAFPSEEAPGMSAFYKNENGDVFHTYSTYGRGLEDFMAVYSLLDRMPKGRDEAELTRPMAWLRHHDRYPKSDIVEVRTATTGVRG
jgi:predicted dithiol-disulfide oxidoreductase (DUF899 family)